MIRPDAEHSGAADGCTPRPPAPQCLTVRDLASRVSLSLNTVPAMRVRGTIGKVTTTSKGHRYFELSDAHARVSCVAWHGSVATGHVVSGAADVDVARVDFYAPFGRCQAVVQSAHALAGGQCLKSEALRALNDAGFVSRARLPLPEVVQHLCLITSSGSAAAGDLLSGIEQRWPGLRTTLIHASVQGADAPAQLAAAFATARALSPSPDVIVCGRGGGSESDLSAFDNELVARCFVGVDAATVSAVGHEHDHVLTDAVADVRAKTPTAAIEIVIPVGLQERVQSLHDIRRHLRGATTACFARALLRVSSLHASLATSTTRSLSMARTSLQVTMQRVQGRPGQLMMQTREKLAKSTLSLQHSSHLCFQARQHALNHNSLRLGQAFDACLRRASCRLDNARESMKRHSLPETWARGFFSVLYTNANGKRTRLCDASHVEHGDELCVLGSAGIMVVTVQSKATRLARGLVPPNV
tara:strand:+ start:3213 stop:4628 length:1416 start_codon:yes stop_codon:yes gene_type:complete